jgi:cellulose synthase/poly-beta-1,6-N-acetylglucosamine synthase-like glycosyltransferase
VTAAAWETCFWVSALGVAYIYAGYPLLICALARLRPLRVERRPNAGPVSVVIVGHDEARNLAEKLQSVFASDDAQLIAEVLVASDGSTDDTPAVVAACGDPRAKLIEFAERRGKPSVLNDVVPRCTSAIVVLTDARQELDRRAIAELTANFADPAVGAVSGELVFRAEGDVTTASQGIGAYWRYEKLIRRHEAAFRSVPGATGALYAIRRSLFRPIPPQTILDDVVIPMQAVAQGYRCLFEPQALAFDDPAASLAKESTRKRRTIAGAAQLVLLYPEWLLPWRNPIWFEYVSHKLARLVSPVLLVALLVSNVVLARSTPYAGFLAAQGVFYLTALAGWWCQRRGRRSAWFGTQLMFVSLNLTTIAALWDALHGRFRATWERTPPPQDSRATLI